MSESPNLERGLQLYNLGRYQDAISYLQKALQEDVNNAEAKFYIAHSHLQLGAIEIAEEMGQALLGETPNDSDVYRMLASIKLRQDKSKEALSLNAQGISLAPYDDYLFAQKAYILLHLKDFKNALIAVDQGLAINPRNTTCLNARGIVLTKLNRKEEAAIAVENVLYENPEDDFSHASSGWVALEHGNIKKALNHFKEALMLDPNSEYARSGMSTALKGKNFLYRAYLKYAFWISKMSTKNQWVFIIGIYIAYRIGYSVLSSFKLDYLAIPLLILYLFFALGVWIAEPISNAILNFDSYGKYLLDSRERISGYLFAGLLGIGVICAVCFFLLDNSYFLLSAITALCCMLPAAHGILRDHENSRLISLVYAGSIPVVAIMTGLFFPSYSILSVILMMVGYTWIGNFLK
ncbi:tetratricopeptide repeat protein [Spongiivirga citrea]|uniref:Tetratricopeptide repeat protein n=1 Tax=Spongiivirga citrea TaxID=1481457 RepID=A0A6M0CFB5_9FLAO|nr:tetratricopeptide repeat protein [Spongiivirga citrea]NER16526.1 tetratricopeptide repeat protein [Spongiivirga citrea]